MNSSRFGQWAEWSRFGLTILLIVACFLWGGGSRLDIPGLIILQPLVVLIATALLLLPGEFRWSAVRTPMLLLLAFGVVMAVQLVPLPPALWQALPGRDPFSSVAELAGVTSVWRPLSLTPDLTLASLVGLSVPAAGLIAFAGLSEERARQLLLCLIIAVALSAVISVGQLVGGSNSAFYRYSVTNEGSAVGWFANRNHQALFVAMAWPMLAVWASSDHLDIQRQQVRRWIACALGLALIPFLIVIGSRAGLVLGLAGLGAAGFVLKSRSVSFPVRRSILPPMRKGVFVMAATALGVGILVTVLASRDEAIQRLYTINLFDDLRVEYLPVLMRLAVDYMPFGSGFGSFDPVFRYHEPDVLLQPFYLNHAHNDWVELLITGGLPAAAVALAFIIWVAHRIVVSRVWRLSSSSERFAYLGASMTVLVLLASAVDYPLRTPVHALLLSFASAWLATPQRRSRRRLSA